jgi:hypothetical protein
MTMFPPAVDFVIFGQAGAEAGNHPASDNDNE